MSKSEQYKYAIQESQAFIANYTPKLNIQAQMSILVGMLRSSFPDWVFIGFYTVEEVQDRKVLEIGAYSASFLPCCRIQIGQGVCGTSVDRKQTVVVYDVNTFDNYIACDPQTQSEIVVPVVKEGEVIAVLDIDSSQVGAFDEIDKEWLEQAVSYLSQSYQ